MGQDLLRVLRFTLSVSVHQCTVSTSILNALLWERETVEACKLKKKKALLDMAGLDTTSN